MQAVLMATLGLNKGQEWQEEHNRGVHRRINLHTTHIHNTQKLLSRGDIPLQLLDTRAWTTSRPSWARTRSCVFVYVDACTAGSGSGGAAALFLFNGKGILYIFQSTSEKNSGDSLWGCSLLKGGKKETDKY